MLGKISTEEYEASKQITAPFTDLIVSPSEGKAVDEESFHDLRQYAKRGSPVH